MPITPNIVEVLSGVPGLSSPALHSQAINFLLEIGRRNSFGVALINYAYQHIRSKMNTTFEFVETLKRRPWVSTHNTLPVAVPPFTTTVQTAIPLFLPAPKTSSTMT